MSTVVNSLLRLDRLPGEKHVRFENGELCLIPQHSPFARFSEADRDAEKKLCGRDFQADGITIVPKTRSTSVGLEVLKRPKNSPNAPLSSWKKIAKLKPTGQNTCVKTSSILAYYHLSRYIGIDLDVPVAVIRTVDKDALRPLVAKALAKTAPAVGAKRSRNHWGWQDLAALIDGKNPQNLRGAVMTSDGEQVYGALYENARNERQDLRFADKTRGIEALPAYRRVTSRGPLSFARAQQAYDAFDLANMLVLDVLLSQQDRLGNVEKTKHRMPDRTIVSRMTLSDNDGGLRTNKLKQLLPTLRHLPKDTFERVQLLAAQWNDPRSGLKKTLEAECLLSPREVEMLGNNIAFVSRTLARLHARGVLRLDLVEPAPTVPLDDEPHVSPFVG